MARDDDFPLVATWLARELTTGELTKRIGVF